MQGVNENQHGAPTNTISTDNEGPGVLVTTKTLQVLPEPFYRASISPARLATAFSTSNLMLLPTRTDPVVTWAFFSSWVEGPVGFFTGRWGGCVPISVRLTHPSSAHKPLGLHVTRDGRNLYGHRTELHIDPPPISLEVNCGAPLSRHHAKYMTRSRQTRYGTPTHGPST